MGGFLVTCSGTFTFNCNTNPMKTLILLCTCIITSLSYSQITHSVYATESEGVNRNVAMAEINGQMVLASVKESREDTLVITTFWMDEFGETSDYQKVQLPGILGQNQLASGMAVNSSGILVFAVLSGDASAMRLNYFEMDLITGVVNQVAQNPMVLKSGFVRSVAKGDSLITYASSANDLYRIATSLDNPVASSTRLVAAGVSYSGSFLSGKKAVELVIKANGNEYIALEQNVFRRDLSGYISGVSGNTAASIYGGAMDVNDSGELLLVAGNQYTLFNSSLGIISEGVIPGGSIYLGRYAELVWYDSKWCLYYKPLGSGESIKVVLDNSLNTLGEYPLGDFNITPHDVYIRANGKKCLIGNKTEPLVGWYNWSYQGYSVFVLSDGALEAPEPFIEYAQVIDHYKQKIHIGHLNEVFYYAGSVAPYQSGFEIESNGVYKSLIFQASNSIIGRNNNGDTIGLFNLYNTYSGRTVEPGPFTPNALKTYENNDKYNRGYYVDRTMIDAHILNVATNPSYDPPFGIKYWPAHGDPSLGQSQNLAPFFDQNTNGIYEPLEGDYPSIYGDQCVLNVFHQIESDTTFLPTGTDNGMECLQYIYVFNCDTSELLKNAVFVNQKFIINTGTINDAYVGALLDLDVGGAVDDYIGTNVDLGMIYGYNGDLFDENYQANTGFHDTLATSGMMLLRGAKLNSDNQDNAVGIGVNESVNGFGFGDGIIDNEYYGLESSSPLDLISGFPTSVNTYYEFFQGQEMGGAYPQVNGVDVRHTYYGRSDPSFYTSGGIDHGNFYYEFASGNLPGDRRIIGSTGPLNLNGNDPNANSIELVTAYISSIDTVNMPANIAEPLDRLFVLGSQLKAMYQQNLGACGVSFDPYITSEGLSIEELALEAYVYPNPANDRVYIAVPTVSTYGVEIYDLQGRQVYANKQLQNVTEIEVSDWNSGVYVIHITTDQGSTSRKLIH